MEIEDLSSDADDFTCNVWLLRNSENVLIDAGTGDSWNRISELESVEKVLITHSHYDHVDNLPKIRDRFDPEIYAFEPENLPVDAEEIGDGQNLELAGHEFRAIHTPGHRDDSVCLYSEDDEILFTGDLIFEDGGFGRTDLEEGDRDLLIESIQEVANLDVDRFYPGHDGAVLERANQMIQKSLEEARKKEPK